MIEHTKHFYTKPGRSLRVKFSWSRYLIRIHIIAVVDDGEVVYRYFGRHKQWWHYGVENWKRIKAYHEWGIKEGED
jgi:hypothetical protein